MAVSRLGLILCLIFIYVCKGEIVCPPEWISHGSHCYYFSISGEERSWYNAQSYCMSLNQKATLASIHSGSENDFVAQNTNTTEDGKLWIGLYKPSMGDNYQWHWLDKTPVNYERWTKPPYEKHSCSAIIINKTWSQMACDTESSFVCKSLPVQQIIASECPNNTWHQLGNNCYLLHTENMESWEDAQASCNRSAPATKLLGIQNEGEAYYIQGLILNSGLNKNVSLWIGLIRNSKESPYIWSGRGVYPEISLWAEGEPKLDSDNLCVSMDKYGRWTVADCSKRMMYICKHYLKHDILETGQHPVHHVVHIMRGIMDEDDDKDPEGSLQSVLGGILAVMLILGSLILVMGLIYKRVSLGSRPYRDDAYEFTVVS